MSLTTTPATTTRAGGRRAITWPQDVILSFWRHRRLIGRLAEREFRARYRGSALGLAWALAAPVAMLAVFNFAFGVVMPARWPQGAATLPVGLILFVGLTVFQIAADCLNRAPRLVLDHAPYVKKVVFPLESLAWIQILGALSQAGFSALVLAGFHLALVGAPPVTALALPVILAPLILFLAGALWLVSGLGVFLRDLQQVMPPLTTALMFLSPVLYPLSAVPESLRFIEAANPLAVILEMARDAVLFGVWPDPLALAILTGSGFLAAWIGLVLFNVGKRQFADVL